MKPAAKAPWITYLALRQPTAFFILIAAVKYGPGVDAPFDATPPFLERLGIKETIGWKVNLLILFGPLLAFLLNATAITRVGVHADPDHLDLEVQLLRRKFNGLVMGLRAGCLVTLFLYLLGEHGNG